MVVNSSIANKTKVTVFTTGGTIEKSYSEQDGSIANRESQLQQKLVSRLRLPFTEIEVCELLQKDSLDMTEEDRVFIHDQIVEAQSRGNPVVVLHGTDTMAKTLKVCEEQGGLLSVPVVFTGAMRPAGFDSSDALQNFTEALYAAQNVEPGLYLSFHGKLFQGSKVRKNRELGSFERTDF